MFACAGWNPSDSASFLTLKLTVDGLVTH
jgi:hypothetical protein